MSTTLTPDADLTALALWATTIPVREAEMLADALDGAGATSPTVALRTALAALIRDARLAHEQRLMVEATSPTIVDPTTSAQATAIRHRRLLALVGALTPGVRHDLAVGYCGAADPMLRALGHALAPLLVGGRR